MAKCCLCLQLMALVLSLELCSGGAQSRSAAGNLTPGCEIEVFESDDVSDRKMRDGFRCCGSPFSQYHAGRDSCKQEELWQLLGGNQHASDALPARMGLEYEAPFKRTLSQMIKMFREAVDNGSCPQVFDDELSLWGYIANKRRTVPCENDVISSEEFDAIQGIEIVNGLTVATDSKTAMDASAEIGLRTEFTYRAKWGHSDASLDLHMNKDTQQTAGRQIEWLSTSTSCMLVVLLIVSLGAILMRVFKNEFQNYTRIHDIAEVLQESSRKWLREDIFQFPRPPNFFCAMLGTETQFLLLTMSVFFWTIFDIFREYNHGAFLSAIMMLYAVTPCISGFVAASWHNTMGTRGNTQTIITIGALILAPQLLLYRYFTSIAVNYDSTQAIPSGTICMMFALWSSVAFPFSVAAGSVFGPYWELNCRAEQRTDDNSNGGSSMLWYLQSLPQVALVGIIPLSAFHFEFYDGLVGVWGYKVYLIWPIVFVVLCVFMAFIILLIISLRYFQLAAQDHRLW